MRNHLCRTERRQIKRRIHAAQQSGANRQRDQRGQNQRLPDEGLLDQTLINLLRNAADAAVEGDQPQVWLSTRLNDRGHPVIEVADNGPGIDPEVMEKIFLPFFTTKAEGSGVGLSLARQVMLVHKGSISAGAREGGGAVFRLTF